MALLTCGLNHKTAPLSIREKCVFYLDAIEAPLKTLVSQPDLHEAAILSTCNRTEIYCASDNPSSLINWFCRHVDMPYSKLEPYLYLHQQQAAVRHAVTVASGMDSLVFGEAQIFGQMKQAFKAAVEVGTIGPYLKRFFPYVFATTKRIRSETAIGQQSISFASVTVELIKRIFSDLTTLNVMLIGAGETIELIAKHLEQHSVSSLMIASRKLEHATRLAQSISLSAHAIPLSDMPERLAQVDVVISATASPVPILGKGSVERAIKLRKHKPMVMLDLAVPRDIEVEVSELDDVFLYNLEDIQRIIEKNLHERVDASKKATLMIEQASESFLRKQEELKAVETVRTMRTQVQHLAQQELEQAKRLLAKGEHPNTVLEFFSNRLINKLLHQPSVQIKRLAQDQQFEALKLIKQILGIES